jgi:hypothetical protein
MKFLGVQTIRIPLGSMSNHMFEDGRLVASLSWRAWILGACLFTLSACSGTLPSIEPPGPLADVQAPPTNGPANPTTSARSSDSARQTITPSASLPCKQCTIVAFRTANVTLFKNVIGQEAERVPKTSIPLPTIGTAVDGTTDRLQIMTLDGVRWVSTAEVEFSQSR